MKNESGTHRSKGGRRIEKGDTRSPVRVLDGKVENDPSPERNSGEPNLFE